MTRAFLALCACALLLVPTVSAKTLEEQMADFHFRELSFTFAWNSETNRANVVVDANDLEITGDAASDLRACIDDNDECPMSDLRQAAGGSDHDGDVTGEEVDSFSETVVLGLRTYEDVKDLLRNLRGLVKVDDQLPTSIGLTGVRLEDAEGSIASTDTIRIYVTVTGSYATVVPAKEHKVWMQRTESNFTVAERVVVKAGKNWKIDGDSIQPASMQGYFSKGRLEGAQNEFESKDPLMFTVSYHKKSSPGWGLTGTAAGLLVAALLVGLVRARRKL